MVENDTKNPEKCTDRPKDEDLEVLIAEILRRARCSEKIKAVGYSRPQSKAIIQGLHERVLDYGRRIDGLVAALKMMQDEKEYWKQFVNRLHKEVNKA